MHWRHLITDGLCEIVYAAAMPRTAGATRLGACLSCLGFIAASISLLSLAARSIPVGTAYAVWVGIGAVGTAACGMLWLGQDRSVGLKPPPLRSSTGD